MAPRMKGVKKLRLGWFTFTCCEGCATVFVELLNDHFKEWRDSIEFKHCRILKSKNVMKDLDLAIVEGAIATKEDVEKLKRIRENSKYVMAVGACALTSMPAALRNNFNAEQFGEIKPILDKFGHLPRMEPISAYIKVDSKVSGCPMGDAAFVRALDGYLKEFGIKR